jgi:peptide-methionine (S)-S-oxide reductase
MALREVIAKNMRSNGICKMPLTRWWFAALLAASAATFTPAFTQTSGGGTQPQLATATFAGGCFWCMESPFDKLEGVVSVTVGYSGGGKANPTYEQVSAGSTGHAEAVQLKYEPAKIGYAKLLDVFWHNVDPVTPTAQFCDHGHQYRSAIFYHDEEQKRLAEASKAELGKSGRFKQPIVTEIVPASTFWPAEDYHQHYYMKNPLRYKFYRTACGRDRRLEELWGRQDHPS